MQVFLHTWKYKIPIDFSVKSWYRIYFLQSEFTALSVFGRIHWTSCSVRKNTFTSYNLIPLQADTYFSSVQLNGLDLTGTDLKIKWDSWKQMEFGNGL